VISVHVTPPNRANCQRREDHSANRTHTDSMVLCSPSGRRKLQYSGGIWQHDCGTEPHCVCLENFPSPGTWRAPRPVSLLSLSSSGPKATRERNPPLLSAMNTTAKRAYYSFFSLSLLGLPDKSTLSLAAAGPAPTQIDDYADRPSFPPFSLEGECDVESCGMQCKAEARVSELGGPGRGAPCKKCRPAT
jgi:hypothetical protein